MSIKAFVFDCGGVILRDGDLGPYRKWEDRLGLAEGELHQRLWGGQAWADAELGRITEKEFWHCAAPEVGLSDHDEIEMMASEIWTTWRVEAEVIELVDALRQSYRVAMLSNATTALESKLTKVYGIADRFDPLLNSARLGMAKPDTRIFEHLCATLSLEPGEIVFIDDRAENIAAAASAGIHVIWFVSPQELAKQLGIYARDTIRIGQPEPTR